MQTVILVFLIFGEMEDTGLQFVDSCLYPDLKNTRSMKSTLKLSGQLFFV